jgi:CRISPR-associated protein (TIGR02584 family)
MSKNILICVTGLTPQIVTETLFCLSVKEKTPIDEIYILTTKRGKYVILGKDTAPNTPKSPLKKEIENLCRQYKLPLPKFENSDTHIIAAKEESIELPDIRSDKDNILFPNKVSAFIREKAADLDNTLYCVITGGRKSMSVHLANSLALFARENDQLLHVLTKEEHEFKDFYPKNKQQANDLEISKIPFVRLRPLLSKQMKSGRLINYSFDRIVSFTQKQVKLATGKNILFVDIEGRELKFGDEVISLEPMELLFYYHFVDKKQKGLGKISIHEIQAPVTSNKFLEYFSQFYPHCYIPDQKKKQWIKTGFNAEDFRSKRSKINQKIKRLISDPDIAELFIIDVDKKWGESKYFIPADKNNFKIIYPLL